MSANIDKIIAGIHEAFDGVSGGDSCTLHQAEITDEYGMSGKPFPHDIW
jgi:hypothetical protein